jgi:hypothetical protein
MSCEIFQFAHGHKGLYVNKDHHRVQTLMNLSYMHPKIPSTINMAKDMTQAWVKNANAS